MMLIMTFDGDFAVGVEFMAADRQVRQATGSAAAASGLDWPHYPYARRARTGWHKAAAGSWAYDGVDEHLWEVFCEQCGDTDGPAEEQQPLVRKLRGPYRGRHGARHAAASHFMHAGQS